MGSTVDLDMIYVVDQLDKQRKDIAHTIQFQLRHMFGIEIPVHPVATLREVGKNLGTHKNELLILGPSAEAHGCLDKALRGFCVATMKEDGPSFEGRLGDDHGVLASKIVHTYNHRRAQLLLIDDAHTTEAATALHNWGLNALVCKADKGNRILRMGKHASFDMLVLGAGVDHYILERIAQDAPPIYLASDKLPAFSEGSDAHCELRERLLDTYGSVEQIKGIICPRDEYSLMTQLAQSYLPQLGSKIREEDLDIDLQRGTSVEPTAILRRDMLSEEGPAKLIYANESAMQSMF
jgi:hypothetical protein